MRKQPKRNYTRIKLDVEPWGNDVKKSYVKTITDKETVFPKPLEYEDIDAAVEEFVSKTIGMVDPDGNEIPTFTLYSNQRFSEYSQSWKHTDNDGNLRMNFKTVNRDNNPKPGDNQGGLWNIPGERRYTLLIRDVLEDNGTESYEVYSMKQPYAVDMSYRVNFVTNKFDLIGKFNMRVNELFKARQCYIRPNGHYVPMVLDEVNDDTQYSIEDRKFFVQSVGIKVMAYIIHADDYRIDKRPKRIKLSFEGDTKNRYPKVEVEPNEVDNKSVDVLIKFPAYGRDAEFDFDMDMEVEKVETENVADLRVFVNDSHTYVAKGFKLHENDSVKVVVQQADLEKPSILRFVGYDPNSSYVKGLTPEFADQQPTVGEHIVVE